MRWFALLSAALLERLIAIFVLVEDGGRWPALALGTLIHLLPKPEGGRRPIGVLCGAVRLWGKIRKELSAEWETENDRSWAWGLRGKTSEWAVWSSAFLTEAAATLMV